MYLDFFGFHQNPFQITPDKNILYMSKQHARALVYMDYAAWQPGGFVVITGEIGSGKTTIIKWLMKNFSGKANTFLVDFTNLTGNDLFHYLLRQVNVQPKKDDKITLIYTFKECLKRLSLSGKPSVLIIDEAQNLTHDQLEDIRMLGALEGPDGPLLRITLLGQPEFLQMIDNSEQFKQRVKLHYHLNGLNLEDVGKYIEYRLVKSGLPENTLFNEEMVEKIWESSKGIPRLINKICDALLMCAYAEERTELALEDIDDILPDLMIGNITNDRITLKKEGGSKSSQSVEVLLPVLERLAAAVEAINIKIDTILKNPKE